MKFFHAYASARKKTNRISFLMTDEGNRVEKADEMGGVILKYFSEVFAAPGRIRSNVDVASPRMVSYEQNMRLTEEVSLEEFTTAVHQMHPQSIWPRRIESSILSELLEGYGKRGV